MDIQITQTGNTIKFLRTADLGGVINEVRFNAANTSITVDNETFKLITSDRYIEVFEWSDVSVPANTGVQSLLTTLNSYIPSSSDVTEIGNIEYIYTEDDFPMSGGEIAPANGINYVIASANFSLTKSINPSSVTTTSTIDFKNNTLIYSGASPMFTGTITGGMVIENAIVLNISSAKIFEVTGNGSPINTLAFADTIFFGFSSVGSLTGLGTIVQQTVQYIDCGLGLKLKDIGLIQLTNNPFSNPSGTSSSPRISVSGTIGTFNSSGSNVTISSGESYIQISKNINMGIAIVSDINYNAIAGSNFFAPDITGAITAFADNGSGGTTVTSATHTLTIEQVLEITGTTNYNSIYNISNITTNTFDIDTAFVGDDATGNFDTGDSEDFLDNISFEFNSNGDQKDTNSICKYISVNPIAITILAANTPVPITGLVGDWSAITERRYEVQAIGSPAGTADYIGKKPLDFRISARISVDVDGGAAKALTAYVTVGGVVQTDSRFTFESGRLMTLNPEDIFSLVTDDCIGLAIENNDDATNISVDSANINIIKA